jgi:hypothetical protein
MSMTFEQLQTLIEQTMLGLAETNKSLSRLEESLEETKAISDQNSRDLRETRIISDQNSRDLRETRIISDQNSRDLRETRIISDQNSRDLRETRAIVDSNARAIEATNNSLDVKFNQIADAVIRGQDRLEKLERRDRRFQAEIRGLRIETRRMLERWLGEPFTDNPDLDDENEE